MLTNKNTQRAALKKRSGLTLIELLVVLVILIGLGGLLVPTITNALSRTHVSSCASTFPEVHQMMQRVQLEFGSFGTGFDSGIYTDGEPVNNSITQGTGAAGAGTLAVENLTADEAAALAAVGITNVFDHSVPAPNVTFDIGATTRPLGDAQPLITLTDAQASAIFLPNATDAGGTAESGEKYIWLGIGRNWSLLSNLTPEPPVHFGDTPGALPNEVHSRFGVIMQVADETGAALERAEFKRTSYCIDGSAFETGDNHIEVYWEEISGS